MAARSDGYGRVNTWRRPAAAGFRAAGLGMAAAGQAQPANPSIAPEADADAVSDRDAIIVTAGKREQALQDVPVAVVVTTAGRIEKARICDLRDIRSMVPSLRVGQFQSSASTGFFIRGLPTRSGCGQAISRRVRGWNGAITRGSHAGPEQSVWGRNLTDSRYIIPIFDSPAQPGGVSGHINRPRRYGVTGRFKF